MAETEPRWYVVQCKPREQARAETHLRNQAYQVWNPQLRREVVSRGQRALRDEPLFPGYLFIRLSQLVDSWAPIRSTRGVARLVGFGSLPAAVPDAVMAGLAARLQGDAGAPTEAALPLFTPGQPLLLTEGPFAGLEAVFSGHDGEARVLVLLKCLNQMQTLSLPLTQVRSRDA